MATSKQILTSYIKPKNLLAPKPVSPAQPITPVSDYVAPQNWLAQQAIRKAAKKQPKQQKSGS